MTNYCNIHALFGRSVKTEIYFQYHDIYSGEQFTFYFCEKCCPLGKILNPDLMKVLKNARVDN
jgi:hypothetical protein